MLLRGPEGSGKSHLAAIWARESGARTLSPRALDGAEVPVALATGALVLENLAEGRFDERALFHLLNLAREERAYVLITARTRAGDVADPGAPISPRGCARCRWWRWRRPTTRCCAPCWSSCSPTASSRSTKAWCRSLTTRIERSFAAARAAVATLDREALRLQRPVTRALAGELFREP